MDAITEEKICYLYYEEKLPIRRISNMVPYGVPTIRKVLERNKGVRSKEEYYILRGSAEYREKLRLKQLGELNNSAKLTTEKVLQIRKEYPYLTRTFTKHQSQLLLAKEHNVARSTISDVVLRRTWNHI